jgi:hypothetical protein
MFRHGTVQRQRVRMGKAKAKPINRVRGGAMGIAALHPSYVLSADRDIAPRLN